GERPEDSVAREVMEELGRDVRGLRGIGEAIQYFHSSDDDCWYRMTAIFFAGELTGPERPDFTAWEWIDPHASSSRFFHQCHVWAIHRCTEPPTDRRRSPCRAGRRTHMA